MTLGEDVEIDWAQQVVRKNTRTSELIKGSGRGSQQSIRNAHARDFSPPVEAPQATTASAFSPSPGPHAAGSPPPYSPQPPPWLSGSAAVLAAGGLGDRTLSSPPPCLPSLASLLAAAAITSSEISIGDQEAGPR